MIRRVLVGNRGEIARRVFRTCRELGISTVAVFSDADADAPHTREADLAVRLAGNAPAQTYLRAEAIVDAAVRTGADAVHPGYGFLSENAGFARAVLDAGLTWVGPPPEVIECMGSKITAKKLVADAGVPVLPMLAEQDVTDADFPVLVKAAAGGGGRGMRVVRSRSGTANTAGTTGAAESAGAAGLAGAIEAASAEAAAAFGDPSVFCEPYLEGGRHIEVQVLADSHGTVWALGERECSIQRRYQKVLEEAPSPLVDAAMRARLCAAATAAARAVGYVGAGTVEFLVAPQERPGLAAHPTAVPPDRRGPGFYFLEMNTRLQVEHPVTEAVTGLDLVRLQLAIAEGAALDAEPPPLTGHAIEVRLYAEDPARGWRPQAGAVHRFAVPGLGGLASAPGVGSKSKYGVRVDSGVVDGSVISTYYDAMLAKVIAWAPTRGEAARRLATALAQARIHGPTTNRDLLVRLLRQPAFLAGDTDTAFFDRHGLDALARPLADDRAVELSTLAAALADAAANRAAARVQGGLPSGWRNVAAQPQRKSYEVGGRTVEVSYRLTRDGGLLAEGHDGVELVAASPAAAVLDIDGVRHRFDVATYPDGGGYSVYVDSPLGPVSLRPVPRFPDATLRPAAGSLLAPMPGAVTAVHATEGDHVTAGQELVVIEAMKMRHSIVSPSEGVVRSLTAVPGAQVEAGTVLAVVSPARANAPANTSANDAAAAKDDDWVDGPSGQ